MSRLTYFVKAALIYPSWVSVFLSVFRYQHFFPMVLDFTDAHSEQWLVWWGKYLADKLYISGFLLCYFALTYLEEGNTVERTHGENPCHACCSPAQLASNLHGASHVLRLQCGGVSLGLCSGIRLDLYVWLKSLSGILENLRLGARERCMWAHRGKVVKVVFQ